MISGAAASGPSLTVGVVTPIVSPNGDGRLDRLRLSVDVEPPGTQPDTVEVSVRLHDKGGGLVTSWRFGVVPGTPLHVATRLLVADGSYELDAAAPEYPPALPIKIEVATKTPVVKLSWNGGALTVVARPANATLGLRATLTLGQPGSTSRWSIPYDPLAGAQQRVRLPGGLISGNYQASIVATDGAGNQTTGQSTIVRVASIGRPLVVRSVPAAGREAVLTFDDGTDEQATISIVHELEAMNEPATLFINAINYRRFPGTVAAVRLGLARGLLTLGDHTYFHRRLTLLDAAEQRAEIGSDEAYVWKTFGRTSLPYLRPPYGAIDARVALVAGDLGFTRLILWSIDPKDYLYPPRAVILARIASQLSPGAIILMHLDTATADALPSVIDLLRSRDYAIVSLPALLTRSSP